jgi:hypothetical protein
MVALRKQEAEITPLARVSIKRNHIVVWEIASESGHTYHVTLFEGRVTSCQREDGTSCPAWLYRHTCHHATLVEAREAAREDACLLADGEKIEDDPFVVHGNGRAIAVTTSDKGHLHSASGKAFSLLR